MEDQHVKKFTALTLSVVLCCASLLSVIPASAQSGGWFNLQGDDGKPVPNMRAPVELTNEIDRLKGVNAIGAAHPDVTVVEFMDYNCPYCRVAANELEKLVRETSGLRVRFVQNAITSPKSEEAARVDLAAFRMAGGQMAYQIHQRLYARRGVNDGKAALAIAADLGLDPASLEKAADGDEVRDALKSHMQLAASLGMNATPSFLINGMIIVGYPGVMTMQRIIGSVLKCDAIVC